MAQRFRDQATNQEFRVPPGGQDIGPIGGVSISPDGFLIAFESWPDGKNHDIYLMTINGADRKPLTTDATYEFSPAWRPQRPTQ
jgi:Tol biopolymer transport system component